MKLKPKIMLLLLPLAILPLTLYMFFCYTYIIGHTQKALIIQLQSLLDQAELDLNRRLQSAEILTHITAASEPVLSLLTGASDEKIQSARDFFKSNSIVNDDLTLMAVIDEQGSPILEHSSSAKPRLDYPAYTQSASESDSVLFSRIEHMQNNQGLQYILTRKLKVQHTDEAGRSAWSRGYLIMALQLGQLSEITEKSQSNGIGTLLFTDATGNSYFPKSDQPMANSRQAITQAVTGRHRAVRKYQVDDSVYRAGFERLRENLYVVAIVPEAERTQVASSLLGYSLWFLGVIFLLCILISYKYIAVTLITPLKFLKSKISDVRDGKISRDFDCSGTDEVAELSQAFREMTCSLLSSQEEVNKLAYYDPLTNLPNKVTFDKALQRGIEHSQISHRALAVLVIDLDNFKLVNDVHGHSAGDEVLKEVAARLRNCLRHIEQADAHNDATPLYAQDMIIRNGGDEFSILLTDLFQAYQASLIAQRIVDELSTPFTINQSKLKLGASVGISLYPVDGLEPEELIKNADLAMFEAKKKGKSNFQFFTPALNASASKRLQTENELRIAIEENQLELYYQPIIHMSTGKITKLEALLRWNHPQRGIILPGQFIPVAEESGQILQLGILAWDMACEQLAKWQTEGFTALRLSVNMSPKQLIKGSPVEAIKNAASKHGVLTHFLEVEVKEDLLTKDQAASIEVLNAIREIGVTISLDDFGSGYSSLSFLKKFPINTIKIDRSQVREMMDDNRTLMIVQTTSRLARDLDLSVVLEGVELESQLQLIKNCNAEYAQGYFFSKPLPAAELDLEKTWDTHNTL